MLVLTVGLAALIILMLPGPQGGVSPLATLRNAPPVPGVVMEEMEVASARRSEIAETVSPAAVMPAPVTPEGVTTETRSREAPPTPEPAAIVSTVMATWFLSSAGAQALGAQIAKLTAAETVGGQVLDPAAALRTYVEVFQMLGWGAVGIGAALGVASFWLRKLAHKGVVDVGVRGGGARPVPAE